MPRAARRVAPDKRDFADAGLAAQEIDRRPNIGYPGRNPVGIFAVARGIGRAVIIEAQNRQPGPAIEQARSCIVRRLQSSS